MNARAAAAIGALLCGIAVALGAYAAHAADPAAARRLAIAALFGFGHGLALVALRARVGKLAIFVRGTLLAGVALFAGSLAWAATMGGQARLAPLGGTLLMLGWLLAAVELLRKD
jgi:uncharacterized membrane protein YgdD (TMEM256/DUF423 family)